MPETLTRIRIFLASPGDVSVEKERLKSIIEGLKPMADFLKLALEPTDWHTVVPDAGRPQQVIFDQIKPTSWDIVIVILWHRFGTPSGANDPHTQKEYLSGTEEEFRVAYRLWKQFGKPRIVTYRCIRPFPFNVDLDQLKRVKDFFKEIENPQGEYRTLVQSFDTPESFDKLVLDNIQQLLVAYDQQSSKKITQEVIDVLIPKIPNNLPRRAAFFGRDKEMTTVMQALRPTDRTWGILIDGIGGIGKTSLAIEAAYCAQEEKLFDAFIFVTAKHNVLKPDGIHELLPPARTLNDFLDETVRIIGQPNIAKLAGEEKRRTILEVLRTMRALLIYDNLETLSKEEQEAMADYLRELPQGSKAIITSRRRGGEGAVWLRVDKLDWNAAKGILENEKNKNASLAKKLQPYEAQWPELFDETKGSPLALIHVLGLMRLSVTFTFEKALTWLRNIGPDDDLMKFIYQEAQKELTVNDKSALDALTFFNPSTTFEAWMEVANLSRNALETTIDRLDALSLVNILPGEERYSLHPLIRSFVREELLKDVEKAYKTGMGFATYWEGFAIRFGGSSDNYRTYYRLEEEWTNLETAADWLFTTANLHNGQIQDKNAANLFLGIVSDLSHSFLKFSGRWDNAIQLEKQCYELMQSMNSWNEAGWRAYHVAFICYFRDDVENMAIWTGNCASSWEKKGIDWEQGAVLQLQGILQGMKGQHEEAKLLFDKALVISRAQNDENFVGLLLQFSSKSLIQLGQYDTAEAYTQEAMKIVERTKDIDARLSALGILGEIAMKRGDLSKARNYYDMVLSLATELGKQQYIAVVNFRLAQILDKEGDLRSALSMATTACKMLEKLRTNDLNKVISFIKEMEMKIV